MNTNDPIEELFRDRSNETFGEKPRDLVWKRIESGLKEEEKKKKPIRDFISSVWFSAAVFALIAIPYFVLFIENINSAQIKENSVEFVKTSRSVQDDKSIVIDTVQTTKNSDLDLEKPIEIVKNDKIDNRPIYKVVEGAPASGTYYSAEHSVFSAPAAGVSAPLASPEKNEERSKILDSIEKREQYAVSAKLSSEIPKDSLTNKRVKIRGVSKMKDTTDRMAMSVVATNNSGTNEVQQANASMEISPKKSAINNSEITYKPVKLTVKSDIVRTNFNLLKKTSSKISFQNREIIISFEKVKNTIILTTNEPNIDPTILGVLEKNKKEIFNYYQSIKK